jgi:hypothetical protein
MGLSTVLSIAAASFLGRAKSVDAAAAFSLAVKRR